MFEDQAERSKVREREEQTVALTRLSYPSRQKDHVPKLRWEAGDLRLMEKAEKSLWWSRRRKRNEEKVLFPDSMEALLRREEKLTELLYSFPRRAVLQEQVLVAGQRQAAAGRGTGCPRTWSGTEQAWLVGRGGGRGNKETLREECLSHSRWDDWTSGEWV